MFVVNLFVVAAFARGDEPAAVQRWAIVTVNGLQDGGLVDLLTAKLSTDDSLQLVERADVSRVFDELSLQASGLVDPRQAVRFSEILSADAILIIERAADGDGAWLSARLVETKNGIRLWSGLVAQPGKDDPTACEAIVRQLRRAKRKIEAEGQRHYVGILDVKSEDLDGASKIFATTLRFTLEHDLQKSPNIVVLEREQVIRLLEERDLTGIEVKLRAATTLIECGVRQVAATSNRRVSLQFISPVTGHSKSVSVVTPADDQEGARKQLAEECLKAIVARRDVESDTTRSNDISRGDEAALFRMRSDWRRSHREKEAAAALAEVAFALEPSMINCDCLTLCCATLAVSEEFSTMERLLAAQRYHQVVDFYLRKGHRDDPKDAIAKYKFVFGCNYRPTQMNAAESQIFEETRRLRRATFELDLAERRLKHGSVVGFYVTRIEKSLYLADSAEEFMADVRSLVAALDRETAAGRFKRTMANGAFRTFFFEMHQQIKYAVRLTPDWKYRSYGLIAVPGDWGPEGIRSLLEWLTEHQDPRTRILGYYGLCELDGEPGNSAAHSLLNIWLNDLTAKDAPGRSAMNSASDRAIKRLRADNQFTEYFEKRLRVAERTSDVASLCRWNSLTSICRHVGGKTEWLERILRVVQTPVADPALVKRAREVDRLLNWSLDYRHRRGQFAPKTDEGWKGISVKRLAVRGETSHLRHLLRVAVDQEPNCEYPIVAAWRTAQQSGKSLLNGSDIVVTRMRKYGGEIVEVGRFHKPGFSPNAFTTGGGKTFLGGRTLGIVEVSPEGVRYFDQRQGLPQSRVEHLAWLEPFLYIGYRGAIGRLDSRSGEFNLLATSRAVELRSPLDGGLVYDVRSMLSDPVNACVWLCIYKPDSGLRRCGIWKYSPDTGEFYHVHKGFVKDMARTDEGLFLLSASPHTSTAHGIWRIFNTETEQCRTLDGIQFFSSSSGNRQPPGCAYLAGGVIGGHGSIRMANGETYQYKSDGHGLWNQPVDQLGRGLVAVSFERRAFWIIEPIVTRRTPRAKP
jgi:hypothetical protein